VALGQPRQLKAISMRTFRERHPWIGDAQGEEDRVAEEDMEEVVRTGLAQAVLRCDMPPVSVARIEKYVKKGDDIFVAIERADADARREQATQAPAPEPGLVAAPETRPGLPGPPQMAAPPEAAPEPPPDARLQAVMAALRSAP